QPFTPVIGLGGFGTGIGDNSGRKPAAAVVDLRAELAFPTGGHKITVFGRVFNAFDTRFFNGFVFDTTGSPYYSIPGENPARLADPTRFYGPRRVEVGLTLGTSGG